MKKMNLQYLHDFYSSRDGIYMKNCVIHGLQKIVNNKKVLFMGFTRPYLNAINNSDIYYALPIEYENQKDPMPLSKKTIYIDDKRLPFLAKTFDVIVILHLIEFSRYSEGFLKEASRLLKDQGKIECISFVKHSIPIKCRSVDRIINLIDKNNSFDINKITGISRGFRVWPYEFKLKISRYNEFLINAIPFVSDLIIIQAKKNELAFITNFETKYGMVNG